VCGAVLAAVSLAGCANVAEPAAREAATSFAAGDDAARCALLAGSTVTSLVREEGESCAAALAQVPLGSGDVVSVEVWGSDALVHLTDDTLFLTEEDGGWRVSAASCQPDGQAPYVCQLESS